MNNKTYRGNIMIRIAAVLFCLVLISTHMMSGLYARYVAKDSSSDEARVAKFQVDAAWSGSVNINVTTTPNGSYTFTVTNSSEVSVRYDVTLTFAAEFPAYITADIGGTVGTVLGNTVKFKDVESLAPATTGTEQTLKFTVNNIDAFTQGANAENYTQTLNFNAVINCVQID